VGGRQSQLDSSTTEATLIHGIERTLLAVSADLPDGVSGDRPGPRKDYAALADSLDGQIVDRSCVDRSLVARLIARAFGVPAAQAWIAFRSRHGCRAILTDGEHIGIPLALLLKLAGARTPHVTIGHRLSAGKKRIFFRWLKVHTHIDRIALHARRQYEIAVEELGLPPDRLEFVPYQVDTDFWRPQAVSEERLICSAGLEFRDYRALMHAVEGLDIRVVIGAASHWSHRKTHPAAAEQPPNVEVDSFNYDGLRDLYARAMVVVVPLEEVDFQAGITTILEAMAMGKPVVVTATSGQTDVIVDRRSTVRGAAPRPPSLLRPLAELEGIVLEPNGLYVPPGDPAALRRAIVYLLDHPEERARLGAAGRRLVERLMTVDHFTRRMVSLVEQVSTGWDHPAPSAPPANDTEAEPSRAS
jgi:glycosyltransferase involved in cell wall biosynthesis